MHVIRYAKLPVIYDTAAIQAELLSSQKDWKPHFNTYDYTGSWNVLALRSPGGSHINTFAELMANDSYSDTIYKEQFPAVKKIIAALHCPVMTIRFLNLQAGAVIKQHKDNDLAFEKGEARLHFPIFTTPGVEFYCEDERISLNEGECWYLNANLPHRVSNNGTTDRIHLVVDCVVNDWLAAQIKTSGHIAYKKTEVDPNTLNMIKELRHQNTAISHKLANELEEKIRVIKNQAI